MSEKFLSGAATVTFYRVPVKDLVDAYRFALFSEDSIETNG